MKKISAILTAILVGIVFLSSAAADSMVETNRKGEIRFSPDEWKSTGISVSDEAEKFPLEVAEALQKDGQIIPAVARVVNRGMVDLLHSAKETTISVGVIYSATAKTVTVTSIPTKTEIQFNPFIFFWGIVMLLMVASNFLLKKGEKDAAAAAAFTAIAAVVLAAIAAIAFTIAAAVAIAIIIAVVAAVAGIVGIVIDDDKKGYWFYSNAFYVHNTLLLMFVYTYQG